jgi:hypothetical protein
LALALTSLHVKQPRASCLTWRKRRREPIGSSSDWALRRKVCILFQRNFHIPLIIGSIVPNRLVVRLFNHYHAWHTFLPECSEIFDLAWRVYNILHKNKVLTHVYVMTNHPRLPQRWGLLFCAGPVNSLMIPDRRTILKIDPIFAMEPKIDMVWHWLLRVDEDRPDANDDDEEYEKEWKKL